MKKLYIVFFVVLAVFTACSEDFLILENPNNLNSANYFKTESDILSAVTATYSEMQQFPSVFNLYLSEGRSNNYYSGTANAQRDIVDISRFSVTSELLTLRDAWKYGYSVISKANRVESVINDVVFTDDSLKTRCIAEVRFIRGYTHFILMRVFGKIPVVKDLLSPEEASSVGRSELADVYLAIEEDLKFAAENLPEKYTSSELGRATKWAAKGILAKVYLTWGQYPLKESSKIDQSVTLLEELIDQNGVYLNWSRYFDEIFLAASDNKYALFEIQYVSGPTGLGATFPSEFLSNSMQEFPFNGGVPRVAPSQDLMGIFDMENDKRFEATFDTTYIDKQAGNPVLKADIITKWFEPELIGLSRYDWPQNYPILRPADIYLMHAEALNIKNNGPTTEALTSLNKVRARAGLADTTLTDKEAFAVNLVYEYRREFVGEGVYWHYLVRSEYAVPYMNWWLKSTNQDVVINEDKLIYPIPYSQMVIKPGLYVQNPGYN